MHWNQINVYYAIFESVVDSKHIFIKQLMLAKINHFCGTRI